MSYITVPYQRIEIPARGDSAAKVLYAPVLKTSLFHYNREHIFYFDSIVDSGADFCVFPANIGKAIGLDIEAGQGIATFGIGGKEMLYFHKIKIEVSIKGEPWSFECRAGFSSKLNSRGIGFLGRDGFFDLFQEVAFSQKVNMFRLKLF